MRQLKADIATLHTRIEERDRALGVTQTKRDEEIRALLNGLMVAVTTSSPDASEAVEATVKDVLTPQSPLGICAAGIGFDEAREKLTDPTKRASLTPPELDLLQRVIGECTPEFACNDKPAAERESCEKDVDRDRKKLALLLRLAAIAFMASGDFQTAALLMMAAGAMEGGDGGGDNPPNPNRAPTPVSTQDPDPTPTTRCGWCDDLGEGYTARQEGQVFIITFPDGKVRQFNLGNVVGASGAQITLDQNRDTITPSRNGTLVLKYCGDQQRNAAGEYGGFDEYTLSEGSVVRATNYKSMRASGASCGASAKE
ncbi:hypothetical protein [Aquimonas sp.]|uniref:hypothetical protein n=1 Tax=Aquimonas sp. TaxID=1872588 RepID=UPI0037C024DC